MQGISAVSHSQRGSYLSVLAPELEAVEIRIQAFESLASAKTETSRLRRHGLLGSEVPRTGRGTCVRIWAGGGDI